MKKRIIEIESLQHGKSLIVSLKNEITKNMKNGDISSHLRNLEKLKAIREFVKKEEKRQESDILFLKILQNS